MRVMPLRRSQIDAWRRLRTELWPGTLPEQHNREMAEILGDPEFNAVFVAVAPDRRLIGFLEASIRLTAEGCRDGPIGYIEGWYVEPDSRGRGVGAALAAKAEAWALAYGCRQMASDAEIENTGGREAHRRLGYEEVTRLAHFRKDLRRPGG